MKTSSLLFISFFMIACLENNYQQEYEDSFDIFVSSDIQDTDASTSDIQIDVAIDIESNISQNYTLPEDIDSIKVSWVQNAQDHKWYYEHEELIKKEEIEVIPYSPLAYFEIYAYYTMYDETHKTIVINPGNMGSFHEILFDKLTEEEIDNIKSCKLVIMTWNEVRLPAHTPYQPEESSDENRIYETYGKVEVTVNGQILQEDQIMSSDGFLLSRP